MKFVKHWVVELSNVLFLVVAVFVAVVSHSHNDIWFGSWVRGSPFTWFCYQLIAESGHRTPATSWPEPLWNITDISVLLKFCRDLFIQQIFQVNNKENIEAPSMIGRFPSQRVSKVYRGCHHWFCSTSRCSNILIIHYNDVIMGAIASLITSLRIAYSIVYSDADQRNHQSSASLAFVRGPVNSPHKWPVTRKCFHLMTSSWKNM